jgi:hypothetical protein
LQRICHHREAKVTAAICKLAARASRRIDRRRGLRQNAFDGAVLADDRLD